MNWISNTLDWIGANEAVLSGTAATIAIIAVLLAISGRMFGLFRTDKKRERPVEESAKKISRVGRTPAKKPTLGGGIGEVDDDATGECNQS